MGIFSQAGNPLGGPQHTCRIFLRRREPTFSQATSNDQHTPKFHQKCHFYLFYHLRSSLRRQLPKHHVTVDLKYRGWIPTGLFLIGHTCHRMENGEGPRNISNPLRKPVCGPMRKPVCGPLWKTVCGPKQKPVCGFN